jgi:uncharacterized protein (TIGR02246 family)
MRARSRAVAGALLLGLAAPAGPQALPGASPTDAEAEIRALDQRWVDAELRRDAAAIAELLDDQFLFIYGSRSRDKDQFVKAVPTFTSTSQVLSEQVVRISGDTAVSMGVDTVEGTSRDGTYYTQRARYASVYIRRQGHWRAFVEHMVQIDAGGG